MSTVNSDILFCDILFFTYYKVGQYVISDAAIEYREYRPIYTHFNYITKVVLSVMFTECTVSHTSQYTPSHFCKYFIISIQVETLNKLYFAAM